MRQMIWKYLNNSGAILSGVFLCSFIASLLVASGCSTINRIERYQPIMGYWETAHDVVVSIQSSPEHGVGAFVMKAPGYLGPEAKVDAPVIVNIQPRSNTVFIGEFLMPDGSRPVVVDIVLTGRNTLRIMSRDKRVQKRVMRWHRVKKP